MRSTTTLVPLTVTLILGIAGGGCRASGTVAMPDSEARAPSSVATPGVRRVVGTNPGRLGAGTQLSPREGNELAAFAAGCFWGVEDTFRQVPGVVATAVAYTGGRTEAPTYESVCSHTTGHAETVLVEFAPTEVSYATLLNVFFKNHDPTTMNRQGPDIGDQYRSHIFTFSAAQEEAARDAKAREQAERGKTVVTVVSAIGRVWKAEEYHQQYDEKSGTHSCPVPRGLAPSGT